MNKWTAGLLLETKAPAFFHPPSLSSLLSFYLSRFSRYTRELASSSFHRLDPSISRACISDISSSVHSGFSTSAGKYSLPPELVSNVAEYLDTGGLLNLRLSSRFLRHRALFTFAKRYFWAASYCESWKALNVWLRSLDMQCLGVQCVPLLYLTWSSAHSVERRRLSLKQISSMSLGWLLYIWPKYSKMPLAVEPFRLLEIHTNTGALLLWIARPDTQLAGMFQESKRCRLGIKQSVIAALTESGAPGMALEVDTSVADKRGLRGLELSKLYRVSRLTQPQWVSTLTSLLILSWILVILSMRSYLPGNSSNCFLSWKNFFSEKFLGIGPSAWPRPTPPPPIPCRPWISGRSGVVPSETIRRRMRGPISFKFFESLGQRPADRLETLDLLSSPSRHCCAYPRWLHIELTKSLSSLMSEENMKLSEKTMNEWRTA